MKTNTLIAANTAHVGGGISLDEGAATIIDSLVRLNKAVITGAAGGFGGGIHSRDSHLVLTGSTSIERNTSEGGPGSGGGVFNTFFGTVEVDGRADITLNTPDNCVNSSGATGCPA